MKIVFFGTPPVAADFLKRLCGNPGHDVAAVVTSPDKPAGRGMKSRESAVKILAESAGIEIICPESLAGGNLAAKLRALAPDVGVVVSYGKIIPRDIFSIPRCGCVNVHFSLLPRWRGAAPVQRALMAGDAESGVSVFFIEEKLDAGKIITSRKLGISSGDDYYTLLAKMIPAGGEALDEALGLIASGRAAAREQNGEPTYAPALEKSDGRIVWNNSAESVCNLVRGVLMWPVAHTRLPSGGFLKITKCFSQISQSETASQPGSVITIRKGEGFVVKCGKGEISVAEVHPENRKKMSAWAFVQGHGVCEGDILI